MSLIGWPKTLRWSDFGTPVASVPSSYTGSHTDCHIEINIDYSWGGVVSIDAQNSWVLQGVSTGSSQASVLKHEQGHYNIAGITARDVDTALK